MEHEISFGRRCRVRNCTRLKITGTEACQVHQPEWRKYKLEHSRSAHAGMRRRIQHPDEQMPWNPTRRRTQRSHDDDGNDEPPPSPHFFGPSRFYCVETICAPCGVVIAWTKFDKSESPTNILNFITSVYPTPDSLPSYICIDKACRVLRTVIVQNQWRWLLDTTRFIVDSYHYINHRVTDYLCRKWCNPAPQDGSAPNLVKIAIDKKGEEYLARAFNTQACEQLNAWLGGFESILKRMKPENFDWFLHVLLFYHTLQVIKKQEKKERLVQLEEEDDDGEEDNEDVIPVRHWSN